MKNITTNNVLFASLAAIAIISVMGVSYAVNTITEEYLIQEYDKIFSDDV